MKVVQFLTISRTLLNAQINLIRFHVLYSNGKWERWLLAPLHAWQLLRVWLYVVLAFWITALLLALIKHGLASIKMPYCFLLKLRKGLSCLKFVIKQLTWLQYLPYYSTTRQIQEQILSVLKVKLSLPSQKMTHKTKKEISDFLYL